MTDAREGDVAVEIVCGCDESTLVRDWHVDGWRCGGCRKKGTPTARRITLGPGGELPVDWRDVEVVAA